MSLKSAWAHNNGKREMNIALDSQKSPKIGWINGQYAERGFGDKLWIKTYSNKKQGNNKVAKLQSEGIDCFLSCKHPFTIIKDSTKTS